MTLTRDLSISVIGDQDLVNGLRMAGITRYHIVEDTGNTREEVREALSQLIDDPTVGVVVLLEEYGEYVRDLVDQIRRKKKVIPVVVEVPSKYGTRYEDVRDYYKRYIKDFIGFELQI